jgi:molecular chaperone DnaK
MKEFGDRLSADMKNKVESANEKLKEAIKGNNISAIKSATEALNNAWNEASTQMYQQATSQPGGGPQAGPQGGQPGAGPAGKADERKVEDAQFEVVDDKDKEKN